MKKLLNVLIVPALVTAALVNCGDPSADSNGDDLDVTEGDLAVGSDPAPPRDPNDPFFANHPRTGTFTLSNGQVMEVPWRAQDIDWWAVFATADLAAMEKLTQGTGYRPYSTVIEGYSRGIVRVHSLNYRDSDNGPYQAFLLTLETYKEDGGPARTFPWVSAYSALVPSLSDDVMFFVRGLVTGDHERTGQKLLGFDKRKSRIGFESSDFGGVQSVLSLALDENEHPVVRTMWTIDVGSNAQFAEANELAHALGLSDATALPPPKAEAFQAGVSRDPMRPGSVKTHDGWAKWTPVMGRWNPWNKLQFSGASDFGLLLYGLNIQPSVIMHDNHGKMSLAPNLGN